MKAGKEHKVPLSAAALAVLATMKKLSGQTSHVFASPTTEGHISNMAMLQTLRRMGLGDLTTHGFRSTFRTWVSETRRADVELAKLALAPVGRTIRDKP